MSEERSLPRLAAMCDSIAETIAGKAAALIDADSLPTNGAIATMPSWAWVLPVIDVGKKGRASDGRRIRMPSRLVWSGGPVIVLAPGVPVELEWHLTCLGHDSHGTVSVLYSEDSGVQTSGSTGSDTPPLWGEFSSPRLAQRLLRGIVNQGVHGRWNLVSSLETFTKKKLIHANTTVAAELGEFAEHAIAAVLDDIAIEELLSEMLYGHGESSVITRMVDRSLLPETFQRVDPMHYFAVGIRARAEEAIRRRIGDPKIGPKIRRVLVRSKATTLDELLIAYKKAHPNDSLAKKRAIAALTAGPEIAAHQRFFHESIHANQVVL
jgi:hypothetical protein